MKLLNPLRIPQLVRLVLVIALTHAGYTANASHLICVVTNDVAVYQIGAPDDWDGGIYDSVSHQWTTPPAPGWVTIESVALLDSGPVDLSVPETLPWNHGGAIGCIGSSQVRYIASGAFMGLSSIRSIVVPECVESIGYAAFNGCSSLESMTLPFVGTSRDEPIDYENEHAFWVCGEHGGSTTRFCYVFGQTFYTNSYKVFFRALSNRDAYCYLPETLRSIVITDETRIDRSSFFECSSLKSITICGGTTNIGYQAFYGCSGLTTITIPDSVVSIAYQAFYDCSELTSIEIPNGVTSIGSGAFWGCSSLTSITIPDSVTSLEYRTFSDCYALASITISDSVANIGDETFRSCSNLVDIVIPPGVTNIGNYAFAGCNNLCSLTLPYCGWAFRDILSGGGRVVSYPDNPRNKRRFPESLTNITISAFSVSSIPDYAFWGCGQYVAFPEMMAPVGIDRIGSCAFYDCTNLVSISLSEGVADIGNYAFSGCLGLSNLSLPDTVTNLGYHAFFDCTGVTNLSLNCISAWNAFSFQNNTNLVSISIGGRIKYIPDNKFQGCSSLSSVTINESVNSIGNSAFSGCTSLESIALSAGLTSIGQYAFRNCSRLADITLPDSLTNLWASAFSGCSPNLFDRTTIPGLRLVDGWVIGYESDIPTAIILSSVRGIAANAFSGCSGLTSITIPGNIANIGSYAFYNCSELASATISTNVTSIGKYAFASCCKLESITIPGSVSCIGDFAFNWCSGLASITIEDGVECVGMSAFYCCSNLTSITIPPSVTSIGDGAFIGCSGLETLYLPRTYSGDPTVPSGCAIVRYDILLSVSSPVGAPAPSGPFAPCVSNAIVSCSVTSPVEQDCFQYVCTGWRGTGSVPASGTGTAVDVLMKKPSSIAWLWETNVWISFETTGDATVSGTGTGWFPKDGVAAVFSFAPAGRQCAFSLAGDTDGVMVDTEAGTISIPTDRPRSVLLVVDPPLVIETASLPDAQLYSSYNHGGLQMSASGGTPPYQWSANGLPDGLHLTEEGELWGFPQEYGEFDIEFSVCDSLGNSVSSNLVCTVNLPPLRIQTWSVPIADAGQPYSTRCLSANGGLPPYVWSVSGLPAGLSASADGRVSGTTEMVGTHDISVVVEDSLGHSASCELELSVCDPDDKKVIYVDASSTATDPNGRSWATAYTDLQTAAQTLSNGRNLILVAPGRYTISSQTLGLDGNTELVSTGGATRTIIDMNWSYDCGIDEFRRIDGFTICNCCYVDPWDPDAIVENCIVTNCDWDSSSVLFPCVLRNCLVFGNWSNSSYDAFVGGARIENCTFFGNAAVIAADCVFVNSIVWNCVDWEGNPTGPQNSFTNCMFTNCLVQGWNADMEGSGSFDADPLFVDPAAGDFRLQSGSPCIDAGLAGIAVWTNDLAGLARVSGRAVDLGAYEFQFAASETRTTPVPVPFEWMDAFSAMLANHGGDYETFGNATASNGVNKVWECYVTGLDPTSATNQFRAEIVFDENGAPKVEWTPDLGSARDYIVEGKESLSDGWGPTNANSRFFRVKVQMPE